MRDLNVADCYIRDLAERTHVPTRLSVLIGRSEHDSESSLGEPAPVIVQKICLEQNTHGILKLEVILDNERTAVRSSDERRISHFPLPRLPKMVVLDGDVSRRLGCGTPAKQNCFAGGFEEVVLDQIGAVLRLTNSARDGMRVRARSSNGDAMEIV